MRKLALQAETGGYGTSDGNDALGVVLDGPAGRYRPDYEGATVRVTLTWLLDAEEYRYMRAFYRTGTVLGFEPFVLDIILTDGLPQQHLAKFISGTMQLVSIQGEAYSVRASVEAAPLPDPITYEVLEALAYLVNVSLPEAIGTG